MNEIEINNIAFCHEGTAAIQPVSLRLSTGDRVVIVGPSNSSKSETALHVVGLNEHGKSEQTDRPRIVISGTNLYDMPPLQRAEITALVSTNPALTQLFAPRS